MNDSDGGENQYISTHQWVAAVIGSTIMGAIVFAAIIDGVPGVINLITSPLFYFVLIISVGIGVLVGLEQD